MSHISFFSTPRHSMSEQYISDEGAVAIGKALKRNQTLRWLE
jgi:hypothetical protein